VRRWQLDSSATGVNEEPQLVPLRQLGIMLTASCQERGNRSADEGDSAYPCRKAFESAIDLR
jgi:hypothetical protein